MNAETPTESPELVRPTRSIFRVLELPPKRNRLTTQFLEDKATRLAGFRLLPPAEFGVGASQKTSEDLSTETIQEIDRYVSLLRSYFTTQPVFPVHKGEVVQDVERECQRLQEFGEACVRANILITNERDEGRLTRQAIEFYMHTRYGMDIVHPSKLLPPDHADKVTPNRFESLEVMERLYYSLDLKKLYVSPGEILENMPVMLTWLIAQEEYFLERGEKVPDVLQVTGSAMIHMAMALESPPEDYRGGVEHYMLGEYARALVLARDAHMRLVAPSLAINIHTQLGEMTGIQPYGHRYYTLAHHTPMTGFAHDYIDKCLKTNPTATGDTWNHSENTVMFESSTKGWWGIVENFVAQRDVKDQITHLVGRLGVDCGLTRRAPGYRFRLANSMVYASALDDLARDHSEDAEVQSLVSALSQYASVLKDHAGVRVVVGSNAWKTAYEMIRGESNVGINFAVTHDGGVTDPVFYLPLTDVMALLSGKLMSTTLEASARLLLDYVVSLIPPDLSEDKKVERLLEQWHEVSRRKDVHPFAAVFWRGTTTYAPGQQAPTEVQVSPYSIAPWNWLARGSYKDMDSTTSTNQ